MPFVTNSPRWIEASSALKQVYLIKPRSPASKKVFGWRWTSRDLFWIYTLKKARIIICGAISQYNNTTAVQGPKNYLSLLVNRARMEGIVVFDYADRYGIAIAEMAGYLRDGKMKSKEDVVVGLDTFPESLLKLFNGETFGKLVLQVAETNPGHAKRVLLN